ncbi:MAG TPA: translation elongation factor Ts [Parachlamydiaceae bacterium]|nr:translation elongation factor Ts [Parachlamydiaceae bacterium]
MSITAAMIKELRDRTGVGMGKCKEALEEAKGDMELAITNLRKAGIASAVKKEGRAANEGMIAVAENKDRIALIEVNAETDFVVKNERFQEFLKDMAEEVVKTNPASLEGFLNQMSSKDPSLTVDQLRATIVQAIGENIQIKRFIIIPKVSDKSIGTYSHLGGKIVSLVEIAGDANEEALAKDIAMHVAAAAPEYLSSEKVPESIVAAEKDIAASQMQDKPANMMENIIKGKLKAFYDQVCLLNQKYIKDDQVTIEELVAKHGKQNGKQLKVVNFLRWNVGQ